MDLKLLFSIIVSVFLVFLLIFISIYNLPVKTNIKDVNENYVKYRNRNVIVEGYLHMDGSKEDFFYLTYEVNSFRYTLYFYYDTNNIEFKNDFLKIQGKVNGKTFTEAGEVIEIKNVKII